jgi:Zn-dependent peptidase ImmA (M78 family)
MVAEAFRSVAGSQSGPLDDLATFIESHANVFVVVDSLPSSVDGLALRDPETGCALIAANNELTWERQRFTLAHELGHLLAGEMVIEAVSGGAAPKAEQAAHEFARNLLVPVHDLQVCSEEMGRPWTAAEAAAVAWQYRVSPQVIGIQLERAGFGTVALTRQLSQATAEAWSRLGGWAPERDSLTASAKTRRIPPGLAESARLAWQDRRIPSATLGRLLGLDTDEVEALLRQVGVEQAKIKTKA